MRELARCRAMWVTATDWMIWCTAHSHSAPAPQRWRHSRLGWTREFVAAQDANDERMNRFTEYQTHNWTTRTRGDSTILTPGPGARRQLRVDRNQLT